MTEQSVPSPSLLMIQNWEEWLRHRKVVLPSIRTLTGWKNGLRGTSCSSTRGSAKSCTWEGTTSLCLGPMSWRVVCQKRPGGPGGHQVENEPAMCPYSKEG